MAKHARWNRQSSRHQHRRPIHRMETQDVFADDMHLGGPADAGEAIKINRAAVIEQRC